MSAEINLKKFHITIKRKSSPSSQKKKYKKYKKKRQKYNCATYNCKFLDFQYIRNIFKPNYPLIFLIFHH